MASNYKGRLNAPLPPFPDLLTSDDFEADVAAYEKEGAERVGLLFAHYGIAQTDGDAWRDLALALARDHVPGLKSPEPKGNPDRNLRILFQMLYLRAFRGLSEKRASEAMSDITPELGKPEAIRSAFREAEFHPSYSQFLKFFGRVEQGAGSETLRLGLRAGIGDIVEDLDQVKPVKRGRPKKN